MWLPPSFAPLVPSLDGRIGTRTARSCTGDQTAEPYLDVPTQRRVRDKRGNSAPPGTSIRMPLGRRSPVADGVCDGGEVVGFSVSTGVFCGGGIWATCLAMCSSSRSSLWPLVDSSSVAEPERDCRSYHDEKAPLTRRDPTRRPSRRIVDSGALSTPRGCPGNDPGGVAPRGTVASEVSGTRVAPPGPVQSGHRQGSDRGRRAAKEAAA